MHPLGDVTDDLWTEVPALLRTGTAPLPAPWEGRFGPLRAGVTDDLVVVAQMGQSLDGRVATRSGHSHYINGPSGLAHLHRLRAVTDAVVVGVGTAIADDPQLTVRHCAGPCPARVVIDPRGRLPDTARLLADDGARRIVVTGNNLGRTWPAGVEAIALARENGSIEPAEILAALAQRGLTRILIEGGGNTVARFLVARCLDRLHIVVAPLIFGSGRPSLSLAPIDNVDEALRPPMGIHDLGGEVLFDCDLAAYRRPIGRAKKSM